MTILKPYMFYSGLCGSCESAGLVFAKSSREAKRIGWQEFGSLFTDEYIDIRVRLLRNSNYLFREGNRDKLENNIPHTNDNPTSCSRCEMWGEEISEDGLCQTCKDDLIIVTKETE